MRVCEELEWVFLRNVGSANAKVFLIPRPGQVLAGKLVTYMRKGITSACFNSRVAGPKKWLQRGRIVIIVSGHQVKLVRWGITHDRGEEIVSQRKLLGQGPQSAHPGSGVVIMPHGHHSIEKSVLVHCA